MKKIALAAVSAAMMITPSIASAQALPSAVIAVVDLQKVQAECTACKTALAALQSQANAIKTRQQALTTPLQTEGKAIQDSVDALKGKEPDAALQQRITAFNAKRQQGAQEISGREQQFQRNQAYIAQQISAKLDPIYKQVMQRRGANLMVEVGNTLATGAALDVTNDVLAALNAALPTVSTTAPAQQQQQPQGR